MATKYMEASEPGFRCVFAANVLEASMKKKIQTGTNI